MASLTTDQAQQIASAEPKENGKHLLATYLAWQPWNEEIDMRQSILLDYLYDHLKFASDKGFPWLQVCHVLTFAAELLEETKGKTLACVLQIYAKKAEDLVVALGEHNFKVYTSFIFSTYLSHFKLYQCVFMHERTKYIPQYNQSVEVPIAPTEFRQGQLVRIWEYETRYKEIETHEVDRVNERYMQQKADRRIVDEELRDVLESVKNVQEPLTKETLGDIIKDVVHSCCAASFQTVETLLTDMQEDTQFKIEKTMLARPTELGPPPRYKPKSPISTRRHSPRRSARTSSQAKMN